MSDAVSSKVRPGRTDKVMEDSVHEENVTTTPPVECVVSPKSHVDIDAVVITCAAIGTLVSGWCKLFE